MYPHRRNRRAPERFEPRDYEASPHRRSSSVLARKRDRTFQRGSLTSPRAKRTRSKRFEGLSSVLSSRSGDLGDRRTSSRLRTKTVLDYNDNGAIKEQEEILAKTYPYFGDDDSEDEVLGRSSEENHRTRLETLNSTSPETPKRYLKELKSVEEVEDSQYPGKRTKRPMKNAILFSSDVSEEEEEEEKEEEEEEEEFTGIVIRLNREEEGFSIRHRQKVRKSSLGNLSVRLLSGDDEDYEQEPTPSDPSVNSDVEQSESDEESEFTDEQYVRRYSLRQRRPHLRSERSLGMRQVSTRSSRAARRSRSTQSMPSTRSRRRLPRTLSPVNHMDMSDESSDEDRVISKHRMNEVSQDKLLPVHWREMGEYNVDPDESERLANAPKSSKMLADINPIEIDEHIDWNSIGGLEGHVRALKEMVVLPLLYPNLFEEMKITPPRGVLFFGPPGTGKTLTARALASMCSTAGKKVSFFMRKGADCLSKWIGEAERQLRLLFEQAQKMQPSIIFFDEIDGLAPVRSSKQDQIHSSIVSTLLALMDGLDNRGQVIVIGATNRVDAIDPALRRPGRFDRELNFSLPCLDARKSILGIHTKPWKTRPSDELLEFLAHKCVGYCGADLRSLCTEASLNAVRRQFPEIYVSDRKVKLSFESVSVGEEDFLAAFDQIVPSSRRSLSLHSKPLASHLKPLLSSELNTIAAKVSRIFPLQAKTSSMVANTQLKDVSTTERRPVLPLRPRLLLLSDSNRGQMHLTNALIHSLEAFPMYSIDLGTLYSDSISRYVEESCVRTILEAKRNSPSVLFLPHLELWWEIASESLRCTFMSLFNDMTEEDSVFLVSFADSTASFEDLPVIVQSLFSGSTAIVHSVEGFADESRRGFFNDLKQTVFKWNGNGKVKKMQKVDLSQVEFDDEEKADVSTEKVKAKDENSENILLKMRVRLRTLTSRLIKEFPNFAYDDEEKEDFDVEGNALYAILERINTKQCQSIEEFLRLMDALVAGVKSEDASQHKEQMLRLNQVCQMQDMALSVICTFPRDLCKATKEIVESRKGAEEEKESDVDVDVEIEVSGAEEEKLKNVPMEIEIEELVSDGVASGDELVVCDREAIEKCIDQLIDRLVQISDGFALEDIEALRLTADRIIMEMRKNTILSLDIVERTCSSILCEIS